jgi:hypothetical protein
VEVLPKAKVLAAKGEGVAQGNSGAEGGGSLKVECRMPMVPEVKPKAVPLVAKPLMAKAKVNATAPVIPEVMPKTEGDGKVQARSSATAQGALECPKRIAAKKRVGGRGP